MVNYKLRVCTNEGECRIEGKGRKEGRGEEDKYLQASPVEKDSFEEGCASVVKKWTGEITE